VPISNNWVENQIRPIALGRSNWLFAGSLRAGKRAAAIMSLLHSARINGHEPYAYLKDVLERLPTHPASRIDELLPHRWDRCGAGDRRRGAVGRRPVQDSVCDRLEPCGAHHRPAKPVGRLRCGRAVDSGHAVRAGPLPVHEGATVLVVLNALRVLQCGDTAAPPMTQRKKGALTHGPRKA
jgi:hypothetical protein